MSESEQPTFRSSSGFSRFIPVIFLLAALLLVILSAVLTRRANEERLLLATQTGQALIDAENTRVAASPYPQSVLTVTP
ncbi:MAG: hypothetical protein KF726_02340 [Anaerolineae bacterium]|nr:hypothetical protein [Anaerolineae bacterium]